MTATRENATWLWCREDTEAQEPSETPADRLWATCNPWVNTKLRIEQVSSKELREEPSWCITSVTQPLTAAILSPLQESQSLSHFALLKGVFGDHRGVLGLVFFFLFVNGRKTNKLLNPVGLIVIPSWWTLKLTRWQLLLYTWKGAIAQASFSCLKQLTRTEIGWLCYPTTALSCTLFLPAGAALSTCHTPRFTQWHGYKQHTNPDRRGVSALRGNVWGAPEQHNSSSKSVWLEKHLFVVAVSCRNVPLHCPCFLSIPGNANPSPQPPNHWLSLPTTAVLALGLWKSEYVSL